MVRNFSGTHCYRYDEGGGDDVIDEPPIVKATMHVGPPSILSIDFGAAAGYDAGHMSLTRITDGAWRVTAYRLEGTTCEADFKGRQLRNTSPPQIQLTGRFSEKTKGRAKRDAGTWTITLTEIL
ncbi:MAG TPA: hypothetical protein VH853_24385 [Polyangia bacterium]|jgi:hypothetical protein|nr:hypothetical protein [Polyangia bacterium]